MASFFTSPFSTFIRGAQTTIHEWQMMLQSLKQTFFAGVAVVAILSAWQIWHKTSPYERYLMSRWVVAGVKTAASGPNATMPFKGKDGRNYTLYAAKYLKSDMVKSVWRKAGHAGMIGVKIGGGLSSIIILVVLAFFYVNGRRQGRDFHVRGAQLGTTGDLTKTLKKLGCKGTISLGGIRLPRDLEPTNIAMIGAPRTGKSVQIAAALQGVRDAGERAIVYDYGGLFTRYFFREGKDVLLNPMDSRSAMWTPWLDISEPADLEQQAASLIPTEKSTDEFWPMSARAIYVALTRKIGQQQAGGSLNRLLHWGLQADTEDLIDYLGSTEARSVLGVDKTAASVRAHLATYLKALNYLRTDGDPFSIRKWISDDDSDSWLFIATNEAQIETVRPLISMWVDIAVSAILSLEENIDRRLWYAVDELTSMQAIPSLAKALTHAPKYGGCGIIGYQSKPMLEKTYGDRPAAALSGGCAIQCIYKANDIETAEWAERMLGQTEVAETNEGISYGVTQLRDGRTSNINRAVRPLVLASEIRALKKFQYFLSLGSGHPVVPIQVSYQKREQHASHYVPFDKKRLVIDLDTEGAPPAVQNVGGTLQPVPQSELPLEGGKGLKPETIRKAKPSAKQSPTLQKKRSKRPQNPKAKARESLNFEQPSVTPNVDDFPEVRG